MRHLVPLPHKFDTSAALGEFTPDLWDRYRFRTDHPQSPHREASDIWVRYNHVGNVGPRFGDPHISVWYDVAEQMPECLRLIQAVSDRVAITKLGGVLITRIPPGKRVYPHQDHGWHAEHYEKFAVLLEGNPEQAFCYEDGEFRCERGESWTFNNQESHWVNNDSSVDRITLIVCGRRDH